MDISPVFASRLLRPTRGFRKMGGGVALDRSSSARLPRFPHDGMPTIGMLAFFPNVVSVAGADDGTDTAGSWEPDRRKMFNPRLRGGLAEPDNGG